MKPRYSSYSSFYQDYSRGVLTCEEMVVYYLQRIKETESLNIYVEVFEEESLKRAKELDSRPDDEPRGRLFGMVVSIKDVLSYKDHKVSGGSKMLESYVALYSATAVERLLEEDAIIIGSVNCDEFAMGSTTENSVYGPSKNALDPTRVPGGSSGGSAVAVQADTCLVSIGSDTGGSVRQPASFCGLVGLKPTYGRISRHGLLAYASSFDQIGPISHSVEDAALLLEVMSGGDDFDATLSGDSFIFEKKQWNGKAKIAYFPSTLSYKGIDPEVKAATAHYLEKLEAAGHVLYPVNFDLLEYLVPTYYVMTTAEASTNLSRYDGIRYGYRSEDGDSLIESYQKSRTEGFGSEVKRRILLGTFVLSSGYYDAYYSKAQKVRRLLVEKTRKIFEFCDFIFMPTSPIVAWELGEKADDPVATYLADIYTVYANLVGIPAIALPAAHHSNGMPIGIQLMADKFKEEELLGWLCGGLREAYGGLGPE